MTQANRSIAPVFASVTNPQIADSEPQGTLPVGPTGVVHRGAGPIPRSTRTPEQVESNRAFMAAAGRVEFGRYEATQRAVWIAFAYFASLGVERICYAESEHIAERAKVSGRTVRRHIPALMERGRIYAENRVGGRTPAVWKVILPDEALSNRGRTLCPARADSVSDDIRDGGTYRAAAPSRGQARPCVKGVKSGSSPVTTAAPLKGSPVPSPSPLIEIATPETAQPHIQAMREIVQRITTITTEQARHQPTSFNLDKDLEARFAEQDRLLHERLAERPSRQPATPITIGCPQCGHDRLMGGSCDQCGYDDGTSFQPSADYNNH